MQASQRLGAIRLQQVRTLSIDCMVFGLVFEGGISGTVPENGRGFQKRCKHQAMSPSLWKSLGQVLHPDVAGKSAEVRSALDYLQHVRCYGVERRLQLNLKAQCLHVRHAHS